MADGSRLGLQHKDGSRGAACVAHSSIGVHCLQPRHTAHAQHAQHIHSDLRHLFIRSVGPERPHDANCAVCGEKLEMVGSPVRMQHAVQDLGLNVPAVHSQDVGELSRRPGIAALQCRLRRAIVAGQQRCHPLPWCLQPQVIGLDFDVVAASSADLNTLNTGRFNGCAATDVGNAAVQLGFAFEPLDGDTVTEVTRRARNAHGPIVVGPPEACHATMRRSAPATVHDRAGESYRASFQTCVPCSSSTLSAVVL
eukprot:scaffold74378_cov71-Phaeocystis_antarctica.AAC.1